MTRVQLSLMELQLQLTLPSAYKNTMVAFPWPEFAGRAELSLFDDAELNIERTLEYRRGFGGAPPWPADYLHIGDDDDACPYALHCGDGTILKTDHGNLAKRPLAAFAKVDIFIRAIQDALGDDT